MRKLKTLGVVAAVMLAGCSEPLLVFPGGELSGASAPPPALWSEVPDVIQLEMRPEDPYSINIWSVGVGADLYIATGPDGNNWLPHIRADANVRVKMDETLYALRAVEVGEDEAERQRVLDAYMEKYEEDPADGLDFVAGGFIFRLDRRA